MSLSKKKEITDRIWTHSKTSGANKLMLFALTELADDDGFCWPSYETLGNMVGLTGTPDSIKRCALNNLAPLIEKNEVIVWKQQGKKGGRGFTNIFLITVGLTGEQIKEIVKRRFDLLDDEADSVLVQTGEVYTRLCTDRRVSSEALERTRDPKKGDTSIQATQPMGDRFITDKGNKGDTSIQDDPAKSQKGDRLAPRTDSLNPVSSPKKESERETPPKQKGQREITIPSFRIFVEITEYYAINAHWRGEMARIVGEKPEDLEFWRRVIIGWTGKYPTKHNVEGMLDFYKRREIPGYQQNGAMKSGSTHQRSDKRSVKALEQTGESAQGEPVHDIYTHEIVYPDGRREPAVSDTS